MRRLLLILAVSFLVIGVLLSVAILNLNRIIAQNRAYALQKISDALGRQVEIQDIKASLGWGVVLDITGLKIADDPALSQLPMVQAGEVYGEAELLPLLSKTLHLRRLVFKEPVLRIIRDQGGNLNLSGIGKPQGVKAQGAGPHAKRPHQALSETAPSAAPAQGGGESPNAAAGLEKFAVNRFSIMNGKVSYLDLAAGGAPLEVSAIDFEVTHFGATTPFDVSGKLAALGNEQNLSFSGQAGPLVQEGQFNPARIPLDISATVGPILLERVRQVSAAGAAVPQALAISEPVQIKAKLGGTLDLLKFGVDTDLSSARVVYEGLLDKPAQVKFKLAANGSRGGGATSVDQANVSLGSLDLKLTNLKIAGGIVQARVDTNRFDLGSLAQSLPAAAKYHTTGDAELHTDLRVQMPHGELVQSGRRGEPGAIRVAGPHVEAQGTVALSGVTVKPEGGKIPAVANLSGTVRLNGSGAAIEPTSFDLGSGHAKIQADVPSFDPLKGTFQFSDDVLKLAELVPSRKSPDGAEEIHELSVDGTLGGSLSAPQVGANVSSPGGLVSGVDFQNLALAAAYGEGRVQVQSLKLNAFNGAIGASAAASLEGARPFQARVNLQNIDLERALASQQAKAAGTVRGLLTGNMQVSGSGANFDQIKPTLRGDGKMAIANGKLIGVNVVAQAMQKTQNVPGIGGLLTPDVVARHPELFSSPDTDIRQASLTFTIEGPRITTHDLAVAASDYRMLGDGSFDMDKNIDMKAQILLSQELSQELEANKKNISYLTDKNGEVQIPLQIAGVLPKPRVTPDVSLMAQTAAQRAVQQQTGKFMGNVLGKKLGPLGGFLGGGSNGGGSSNPSGGSPAPAPANPLEQFKGLFR